MYQFTYETSAKHVLYQTLLYTMDEDSDGRGLSAVSLYPFIFFIHVYQFRVSVLHKIVTQ